MKPSMMTQSGSHLPSISVCFPAYNEEATIGEVLQEAHRLLSESGLEYEILVCNDGSVDRTGDIIETLASHIPHLRIFHHPRNLGICCTFERLYSEASKEFVFLNATDRQWRTGILFDMLPLTKESDIIVASRIKKHYGLLRQFVSWGFNTVPLILFGVRTFDAGAVKLTRREIIQRFSLVSTSPFSEAERIIRATRAGYRITEYPVEVSLRKTGRARGIRFRFLLRALLDIPRVWWDFHNRSADKANISALKGTAKDTVADPPCEPGK
jgi:glycosyltransferase involved in cell wall biosynthesis